MRKIYTLLCLVFLLLFLSSCKLDEIITEEIIDEIISETINNEKIFINVYTNNKMKIPLKHKGSEIIWEYDKAYFNLENDTLTPIKNGTTIMSSTYLNQKSLYSITIKEQNIVNTVQYNLKFHYQFINDNKKVGKNITPSKIVFHNTAKTASAENEIKWLKNKENTSSTSFHFAVDDTGVYQAIPTNKASYHAGDIEINHESIGIEIAKSMIEDEKIKNSGIKNATIFIKLLMSYYDIKIENVITHKQASGKHCPHDIFNRYGIDNFYNDIIDLI